MVKQGNPRPAGVSRGGESRSGAAGPLFQVSATGEEQGAARPPHPQAPTSAERRWSRGPGPRKRARAPRGPSAAHRCSTPTSPWAPPHHTARPAHFTGGQVEPWPRRAIPTQACNSTAQAPHRAPGSLPDEGHPGGWLPRGSQAMGLRGVPGGLDPLSSTKGLCAWQGERSRPSTKSH